MVLNAAGGECLDDSVRLREDPGLTELIGHPIPSPEAARHFLYQFHEEKNITAAKAQRKLGEIAYIPGENQAWQGLGQVNRDLMAALRQRCADQRIATVDLDSTIIESRKREALPTYEGERGYQPMLAVWAEMNLVLADQFRDGNVPAIMDPLHVVQVAYAVLPGGVKTFYFWGIRPAMSTV